MSDRIAVAKALLKAGNLQGAEREVRALLERDPHDRDALDVAISVATEKGDHKRALALTDDWVAREPDLARAHQQRILALARARKKRQARKALARYKADFPLDSANYEVMWLAVETLFGKSDAVIRKIRALRKESGEELPFDQIEAVAKTKSGQLFGGSRAADRVLEKDPLNATALLMKACNAFRLCRLRKARRFARQLREVEPSRAGQANEVIYASYAAYFPPFLVAQLLLILVYLASSRVPMMLGAYLAYMASPLLAIPLILLVNHLADRTGIPNFHEIFYLSMGGWCFYALFIFQRFSGRFGAKKSVALSRDY